MDLAVGEIDSLRKEMSMLQLKDIRKNYEEGDHVVRALRALPAAKAHGTLQQIVTAVTGDAQPKAPRAKGGCLGTAEAGGFRRQAGVHIGLCFW